MALSQSERNKKWQEKNKEHSKYLRYRSSARSFIRNNATLEDLEELRELIRLREEDLNKDY